MRILLLVFTFLLSSLPAVAQSPWQVAVRVGDLSDQFEGTRQSVGPISGNTPWLSAEASVAGWGNGMTCATMPQFEADLFFGRGQTDWEVHLIVDLIRGPNNTWRQDFPTAFYAEINNAGFASNTWENMGDVQMLIKRVECTADDRVLIEMSYSGALIDSRGDQRMLTGTARAEFQLGLYQ